MPSSRVVVFGSLGRILSHGGHPPNSSASSHTLRGLNRSLGDHNLQLLHPVKKFERALTSHIDQTINETGVIKGAVRRRGKASLRLGQ